MQYIAPFSEMNFFVGANNAGKSIVLNFLHDRLPLSLSQQKPQLLQRRSADPDQTKVESFLGAETGNLASMIGISTEQFLRPIKEKYPEFMSSEYSIDDPLKAIFECLSVAECIWLKPTGQLDNLILDLSRFDAAPLIAFTATKETDYGTETDGRIPPRCGAYRIDQWANAYPSGYFSAKS